VSGRGVAASVLSVAVDVTGMACPICGRELQNKGGYPNPVCDDCDERAVNADGDPAEYGFEYLDREPESGGGIQMEPQTGDNPVFVDGEKCWRRYRHGGWVTMKDEHDCDSLEEFLEAHETG